MREKFLEMVIYQIYPRSFKDSNGDGIGDLKGIIEKLDYLEELGINTVWLSPCYKSPNYDNGYDISDYRAIAQDFGTFEDWQQLISLMHKKGIKLLMDLVVNHTSSEHEWFKQAKLSRDNPYHDYYIWADKPLNDWQSVFGGSAWEYNEATNEYYLHSFAIQQPDLNWENPQVRKEACDIVDFWVDLGVDGFRCDVLDFISKDFDQNKMYCGPRLHEYINLLFGREKVKHIFTLGECQSNEKSINDICGKDRNELTTVFQFDHIHLARSDKNTPCPFEFDQLKDLLVSWQNFAQKNELLYMLFTDNHDQPYYLSRIGNDKELRYESATCLATAFYLLKGIPLIYQGQEFGSANSYFNGISHFNDVETINYYNFNKGKMPEDILMQKVNYGSRDNPRRPICWTSSKEQNFGFTTGAPWLEMPTRGEEINLEKDKNSQKSIFNYFKELLLFRKNNPAIIYGDFTDLTGDRKDCFIFKRCLNGEKIIVVCNFKNKKTIELPEELYSEKYNFAFSNYSNYLYFDTDFRPFEIAVFKL